MQCAKVILGVCLNPASAGPGYSVLGFPEFLTALALLILVYNLTDARYRFRVQTAPIPLFPITFVVTAVIGIGTLLTELWFTHAWLAPTWGFTRVDIQAIFGFAFLLLTLVWTWFAFLAPSRFGRLNALRYVRAVYHSLMRGGREQYDALSRELQLSSRSIIKHATGYRARPRRQKAGTKHSIPKTQQFAYELLGLLPHRPFCRFLVVQSPTTAISLLRDAAEAKLYPPEVGHFAHQIANAAMEDRESILYHEAEYFTGIIGRLQSFKKALFGNHELVERSGHSALDLDYRLARKMTGDQVDMYGECVLATFEDYISHNGLHSHSSCLNRALEQLHSFTDDLYTLDQQQVYPSEPYEKTRAVMQTLRDMIRKLDEAEGDTWTIVPLRSSGHNHDETVFDSIVDTLFEIVTHAGSISGPFWTTWSIQHNTIWSPLARDGRAGGTAIAIVAFKLRRRLYDEIRRMEEFPNFQGARVLLFCLNVMAWSTDRNIYPVSDYPLRKVVIEWVKKNYAALHAASPEVAEACLTDRMEYDIAKARLVRRHEKSILSNERVDYVELEVKPAPFKKLVRKLTFKKP